MVCTIANPLVKPGLETALNDALQEYLAIVKGKLYPHNDMEGSQMIPPQGWNRIQMLGSVRPFVRSFGSDFGVGASDLPCDDVAQWCVKALLVEARLYCCLW